MMKRIICMLCMLMICCGMIPMECDAAMIDPNQPCSLTLSYTRNGNGFSDLNIDIYRVAEFSENGKYKLLEPFSNYPIRIHGITSQKEWQDTAQTVKNYVVANHIEPYRSQKTDDNGQVYFAGLETGLYMVKGVAVKNEGEVVIFQDFMIYLPTPAENDYDYDVEAKPKYMSYTQPDIPSEKYTVVKLWKDTADSSMRPKSVYVDILKNGIVQKTVVLNSANNWSYSWDVLNDARNWSVMEKNVPNGYQVSITNNNTIFTIINSKSPVDPDDPVIPDEPGKPGEPAVPDTPDEPLIIPGKPVEDIPNPENPLKDVPKTGDVSPMMLYISIMCISGFALMILSVLRLKEGKHEKSR